MTEQDWLIHARAAIFDSLVNDGSLQSIIDCAYSLLGNPLCVAISNGEILGSATGGVLDDPLWESHIRNGYISKTVKYQTERASSMAAGKSFIWERNLGRYRMMMYNGSHQKTINLRIVMLEARRPFSNLDQQIFEIFSQTVYYCMRNSELALNFDSNTDEYFLHEILRGKIDLANNRTEIFERLNLCENSGFGMLVMKSLQEYSADWFNDVKKWLHQMLSGTIVVAYEERLICFYTSVNNTDMQTLIRFHLPAFLKKQNSAACLSNAFTEIQYLNEIYLQTKTILDIGIQTSTQCRLYFAEMMLPDYLLSYVDKENLPRYYHEAVFGLLEFDRKNDSQLLLTLYAYLLASGNITGSSKLLGIHYNTMKQRLQRIKDITKGTIESRTDFPVMLSVKALALAYPNEVSFLRELEYMQKTSEGEQDAHE